MKGDRWQRGSSVLCTVTMRVKWRRGVAARRSSWVHLAKSANLAQPDAIRICVAKLVVHEQLANKKLSPAILHLGSQPGPVVS